MVPIRTKQNKILQPKMQICFPKHSVLLWMGEGERKRKFQHKNGHVDQWIQERNNKNL